jgi:hypothetical protein
LSAKGFGFHIDDVNGKIVIDSVSHSLILQGCVNHTFTVCDDGL